MKAAISAALLLAAWAGTAAPAFAQARAQKDAGATKQPEAERRFRRGIDLYKDGDFAAALVEFKRAYELVPSYKILYNLGQVSFQRHDHAAALRYFRQYLADGNDGITTERRREVAAAIVELEPRVGRIDVQTGDNGVEVFIDDVLIGTTPLHALTAVNAGRRKVDVVARNGDHRSRVIDVAGGEIVPVLFPRLASRPAEAAPAPPPEPLGQPKTGALAAALPAAPPPPAPAASPVATAVASPAASVPVAVATPARKSKFPWKSWTLTGLLAGGAATTGVFAVQSKRDYDSVVNTFPADPNDVDYYQRRTRGFAMATDGLLIGTAVMAAISIYLTLRDPG
jgi:hypothetical protein